jgi:(5-formylfuran-3-yl)methyl phosphate synthase
MPLPSLLVSVRNLAEARAAIDGGCDRLDVKEPLRGPLGMADVNVIAEIATFSAQAARHRDAVPCSVALGEIHESQESDGPFVLPSGVSDIKLGPARLGTSKRWTDDWGHALRRFRCEQPHSIRRVAVAYADWSTAGALPPAAILAAAIEAGADAFLIDTYRKDTGGLLDALSLQELGRISGAVHRAGMTLALAGSLRLEDLAALVELRPDVIAVRGAACEGRRRSADVSTACVRRLRAAISELF